MPGMATSLALGCIGDVATLTPLPALHLAFSLLKTIGETVEQIQAQKNQAKVLLDVCAQVFLCVHRKLEAVPQHETEIDEILSSNIQRLEDALTDVNKDLLRINGMPFIRRVLQRDDIADTLSRHNDTIPRLLTLFMVESHIDAAVNDRKDREARQRDAQQLNNLMAEATSNSERLMELIRLSQTTVEVRLAEIRDLLALSMRQMRLQRAGSPERAFFQATNQSMQTLSQGRYSPPPDWDVSPLEVEKDKVIGYGAHSTVYRGRMNKRVVAIKELLGGCDNAMRQEIETWRKLDHPRIHRFLYAHTGQDPPFIVSVYYQNGNALRYLAEINRQADRCALIWDVASGMQYLHQHGWLHGDLKASNVLIDDHGRACISDFGLARLKLHTTVTTNSTGHSNTSGTTAWMSPQRLQGGPLNRKDEVYSFAITALEICTGQVPFSQTDVYFLVVQKEQRPPRPFDLDEVVPACADQLWNLIEECWAQEASQRPDFHEIVDRLGGFVEMPFNRTRTVPPPISTGRRTSSPRAFSASSNGSHDQTLSVHQSTTPSIRNRPDMILTPTTPISSTSAIPAVEQDFLEQATYSPQDFAKLVKCLREPAPSKRHAALQALVRLSRSATEAQRERLVAADLLPALQDILKKSTTPRTSIFRFRDTRTVSRLGISSIPGDEELEVAGCALIQHLIKGSSSLCGEVVDAGICHSLVQLMHSPCLEIRVQACCALSEMDFNLARVAYPAVNAGIILELTKLLKANESDSIAEVCLPLAQRLLPLFPSSGKPIDRLLRGLTRAIKLRHSPYTTITACDILTSLAGRDAATSFKIASASNLMACFHSLMTDEDPLVPLAACKVIVAVCASHSDPRSHAPIRPPLENPQMLYTQGPGRTMTLKTTPAADAHASREHSIRVSSAVKDEARQHVLAAGLCNAIGSLLNHVSAEVQATALKALRNLSSHPASQHPMLALLPSIVECLSLNRTNQIFLAAIKLLQTISRYDSGAALAIISTPSLLELLVSHVARGDTVGQEVRSLVNRLSAMKKVASQSASSRYVSSPYVRPDAMEISLLQGLVGSTDDLVVSAAQNLSSLLDLPNPPKSKAPPP